MRCACIVHKVCIERIPVNLCLCRNSFGNRASQPEARITRELEPLEPVQRPRLDRRLVARAAVADPGPAFDQELLPLAVRLEIDRRDDAVADQHRQREIAEPRFSFGT